MTTLSRKLRRARAKRSGNEWPTRERPFRMNERGGGYSVLTPTNSWKRFSQRRLNAQARLRAIAEYIAANSSA
jgi:hypothetical protein